MVFCFGENVISNAPFRTLIRSKNLFVRICAKISLWSKRMKRAWWHIVAAALNQLISVWDEDGKSLCLCGGNSSLSLYTLCCWRTLTLNGELTVCALCECAPPLSLVRVRVSLNCVRHMRVYISKCVKCARASCVRCAKRDAQEACGSRELSTGRKNFYFSRYSRGDKSGKTLCKHTEKNEQWRIKRGENL